MINNIQIYQYSGSEYNQLNPNISNLANNSNQLGGIDSSQYATKEYADGINPDFLGHKKIVTFANFNGIFDQMVSLNENKFDIRKLQSVIIKFNNINVILGNNAYVYVEFKIGDVISFSVSPLVSYSSSSSTMITDSYVKYQSGSLSDFGTPYFPNGINSSKQMHYSLSTFDKANNNFFVDKIRLVFGNLSSYGSGSFDVYVKV